LQKQFRPPIDQVVIEVPAGLIDEGESAEECALRELREETGYVGRLVEGWEGTGVMFNGVCSSWLCCFELFISLYWGLFCVLWVGCGKVVGMGKDNTWL
jgi:8-oxo-dGTP pyrophosphatase MutT (NUDIX family)